MLVFDGRISRGEFDDLLRRHPNDHPHDLVGLEGGSWPTYFCEVSFGSVLPGSSINSAVPRISTYRYGLSVAKIEMLTLGSLPILRALSRAVVVEKSTPYRSQRSGGCRRRSAWRGWRVLAVEEAPGRLGESGCHTASYRLTCGWLFLRRVARPQATAGKGGGGGPEGIRPPDLLTAMRM